MTQTASDIDVNVVGPPGPAPSHVGCSNMPGRLALHKLNTQPALALRASSPGPEETASPGASRPRFQKQNTMPPALRRRCSGPPALDLSGCRGGVVAAARWDAEGEEEDGVLSPSTASGNRCDATNAAGKQLGGVYLIGEVVGKGTFSKVCRASRRIDGWSLAVKSVKSTDGEVRQSIQTEYDLLRVLQHKNIVTVKDFFVGVTSMHIIMEYCSDGSVQDYVDSYGSLSIDRATKLLLQLVKGVNYLHTKRIVHRDVKPQNLLLCRNARKLKITDFNSAKQIGGGTSMMLTDRGTHLYSAPELRFGGCWNERVDIWASGLSYYFMMTSRLPFNISKTEVAKALLLKSLPDHICWDGMSDYVRNIVEQCLTVDMHDRPTAMELQLHPVFMADESPIPAWSGSDQEELNNPSKALAWNVPSSPKDWLPSCGLLTAKVTKKKPREDRVQHMNSEDCWNDFGDTPPVDSDICVASAVLERFSLQSQQNPVRATSEWSERRYSQDSLRRLARNRCERMLAQEGVGRKTWRPPPPRVMDRVTSDEAPPFARRFNTLTAANQLLLDFDSTELR